eukprot:3544565-Prymnesium_polylepis.1
MTAVSASSMSFLLRIVSKGPDLRDAQRPGIFTRPCRYVRRSRMVPSVAFAFCCGDCGRLSCEHLCCAFLSALRMVSRALSAASAELFLSWHFAQTATRSPLKAMQLHKM